MLSEGLEMVSGVLAAVVGLATGNVVGVVVSVVATGSVSVVTGDELLLAVLAAKPLCAGGIERRIATETWAGAGPPEPSSIDTAT